MRIVIVLALVALLALTGCTPVAVSIEHDRRFDFTSLHTYAWGETTIETAGGAATRPDLDARIRAEVDERLGDRGYARVDDGAADFHLRYRLTLDRAVASQTVSQYAGQQQSRYLAQAGTSRDRPRETAQPFSAEVTYEEGLLVLDVVLPDSSRRVWRGFARAIIDPDEAESTSDRRLRAAIDALLERFPPT